MVTFPEMKPDMKVLTTPQAARHILERGGNLWIWLDPHRGLIGSYVGLEAHTEPPGASRQTRFTRSSRRPHRFSRQDVGDYVLHYDFGRMDMPEEVQVELRGWVNKRVEAFWNGCVFVDDVPPLPDQAAFDVRKRS
jgi:hypothetical protein